MPRRQVSIALCQLSPDLPCSPVSITEQQRLTPPPPSAPHPPPPLSTFWVTARAQCRDLLQFAAGYSGAAGYRVCPCLSTRLLKLPQDFVTNFVPACGSQQSPPGNPESRHRRTGAELLAPGAAARRGRPRVTRKAALRRAACAFLSKAGGSLLTRSGPAPWQGLQHSPRGLLEQCEPWPRRSGCQCCARPRR